MVVAGPTGEASPLSGQHVVIITGDPIGVKLAGPAIRAWSIAELLCVDHSVRLVSLTAIDDVSAPFELLKVIPGDEKAFAAHEEWADVIIFQGHAMEAFNCLRVSKKILVADIYDPMHLEQLEQAREFSVEVWEARVTNATDVLNRQLARADFFICASERQRLFYLGQLAALGRINPANYERDSGLDSLLAVVPFGLSRVDPQHARQVLKGILPGIAAEDKVLLWSGGLYNWFDPGTLIRAVAELSFRRPNVRLFFQGTKHPHPGVPEMAIVGESRALAESLGALNTSVFFNQSWVDFSERQNYLLEADVGVSTHHVHVETTLSFRTRILDYLWAGLPMVVTEGDTFAELVERENLGIVVSANNEHELAAALERVLFDEAAVAEIKSNVTRVRQQFYWDIVMEPLRHFVLNATRSADFEEVDRAGALQRLPVDQTRLPFVLRGLIAVWRAWRLLITQGPKVLICKVRDRFKR